MWRTTLAGWKRYKDYPDARVRQRFEWEARSLKTAASGLLWAMEHQLRRTNRSVSRQIRALRKELGREFGPLSRLASALGPALLWASWRERRRLARGVTYEPETVIERRNWAGYSGTCSVPTVPDGMSRKPMLNPAVPAGVFTRAPSTSPLS